MLLLANFLEAAGRNDCVLVDGRYLLKEIFRCVRFFNVNPLGPFISLGRHFDNRHEAPADPDPINAGDC